MFRKARQQLGDAISVPAKNASLLSLLALSVALVSLLMVIVTMKVS